MTGKRPLYLLIALLEAVAILHPGGAAASDCDEPRPEWLMCEDFEGALAGFPDWFADSGFVQCQGCSGGTHDPARLHLSDDPDHVHEGDWAIHMPAGAASGHQGGELIYRSCVGEGRVGCALENHDTLHLRTWVKLAPDHEYVHHFLGLKGSRADRFYESQGNAGCRPNGYRHAGSRVDMNTSHELFFYTYHPEMRCDSGGYCSGDYAERICEGCAEKGMACAEGLECCWGNHFEPSPRESIPRGEWVCLEMMVRLNTPGVDDGEMAFWIDDRLAHRVEGMYWRDVPELGLNQADLSHFIDPDDASRSNRISFDDVIVSTERIGCTFTPGGGGADAGLGEEHRDAGSPEEPGDERDAGSRGEPGDEGDGSPLADEAPRDAVSGGCSIGLGPLPPSPRDLLFALLFLLQVWVLTVGRRRMDGRGR